MFGRNEGLLKGDWHSNHILSNVLPFLKIKYFIPVAIVSCYSISCRAMCFYVKEKRMSPGSKIFLSQKVTGFI